MIRCGFARAGSTRVATAAACRCRGPATQPPYGFSGDGVDRPGSISRSTGPRSPSRPQSGDPGVDARASTAPGSACAARRPGARATTLALAARPRRRARVRARRALHLSRQLRPDPVDLPAGADVLIASDELEGGVVPQDTTVWLRRAEQAPSPQTPEPDRSRKGRTMKSIRIDHGRGAVAASWPSARPRPPSGRRRSRSRISVASLIPGSHAGSDPAVQRSRSREFEKANPSIKVKPVEYQWTGPTFAAKLAAGTLPTVFDVPFTDARTLGDNGQLADLTAGVKALPYFSKYNKAVLAEGTDSKGQIVALPKGAYAQALHYNRKLFTQAGLDPNKPPTTWAAGRDRRAAISQKTGKAGYVRDGEGRQHRGLDPDHARLRARRPHGAGHRHEGEVATLDNPQTVDGAQPPASHAVDRQLDGLELRLRLERHQPGVRRRQRRHVHQRLRRLHEPRPGLEHRSVDLRPRADLRSRRTRRPASSAAARWPP